jgi:hypothetical protein
METTFDPDKRKLLSAAAHGSIFLSMLVFSAGIPLVLWLISEDPVVKGNAQEALNFHFNVWAYGIVFGLLTWVLIGWPLLGLLALAQLIMPVLAIVSNLRNPAEVYRYPLILRVL